MFSIICCSVRPDSAEALKQNIKATIGNCDYETIFIDNRGAEAAKYDYLCFVHEDIEFLTPAWGEIIAAKLREEDCGVIGFAGSIIRTNHPIGWRMGIDDMRAHYVQHSRKKIHTVHTNNSKNEDYSAVVTLDGMCLIVRRDVWEQNRFDEELLVGFHGYDIDFSLSVSRNYKNWVCNVVEMAHFSEGAYSNDWARTMVELNQKWQKHLPMTAYTMGDKELAKRQQEGEFYYIRFMWQKGFFNHVSLKDGLRHFKKYPAHKSSWKLLMKYAVYRLRHRKNTKKK